MNEIALLLGKLHPELGKLTGLPLWVFILVFILTLVFLVGYAVKGGQIWKELRLAQRRVRVIKQKGSSPSPRQVAKAFPAEPLRHLWDEYADTLHEVRKAGAGGENLVEVRATVPADAFFTREVLVDSRLFDEFTRHLPGILTGLGIIGTFAGLLEGLTGFSPTPIEEAVKGLGPLLGGVKHAFVASGAAIGCAMLVVFVSRFTVASLYRLVEQLTHAVDSLYSTGAGEEYLARLVKSSEQNAATSAQLKDALVEDLHKMMANLVERQISAQQASTAALGQHIGEALSTAIADPMKRLGDAMELTATGNGEQVTGMLETLLTGFMAKLEDTFGSQMRGINEQMERSMTAMASVQGSLEGLLADIKKTNEHAATQMSGALEEAMKKSADNQQLLTDQMRQFVQEFRQLVTEEQDKSKRAMGDAAERMTAALGEAMRLAADSQQQLTSQMREFVDEFRRTNTDEQTKSRHAMAETVARVLGEVSSAVERLEAVRKQAAEEEHGRHRELGNRTQELVGGLTTQVEAILAAVSQQVTQTQQNIDVLGQVTTRAIEGMNQGALTMGGAAQRFEVAGNSVSGVLERSGKVSESLTSASATLQTAAGAVQRGFEQYESTRKTVETQVAALTGLIESARREAGVSRELVDSIRASAEAMRKAEAESRAHLDQVNAALVKAFSDFGSALVSQVRSTIAETDRHLSQGTGHLNGVVAELASAVQRMKRA